jgi:tetratricopeptide (TPR) repeat protein
MELIEGDTLAERLRGGALQPTVALPLIRQIALALNAAHGNEVVHRDLKSSNIILETLKSGELKAKVTDFGIASGSLLRQTAFPAGSPVYMAPEQREGAEPTPACDIYSLGIVAYEMVTGEAPENGIVRPHPKLPRRWERAIVRCLHPKPAERFADAPAFADALEGRPDGLLGRRNLMLLLSGGAISGLAWLIQRPAQSDAVGVGGALSLAVAPFESAEPDLQPMAMGISGDVIRALAASPLLHVTGEASSRAAISNQQSWIAAAQRLRVEHVLTGRLRRAGGDIAVDVQIRRVEGEAIEWQQTLAEPAAQVAHLAPVIAKAIAAAMHVQLRPDAGFAMAPPQVTGTEAYEQYLLGRAASLQRNQQSLEESIRRYQAALALAPAFAPAYSGMAVSYNILAGNSGHPLLPTFELGTQAAQQALTIDRTSGEAFLALASITQRRDWDWQKSESYYRSAMLYSPGTATVHQWFSGLLSILRRPEEAVTAAERACALEPLALPPKAALSGMLYRARRYEEAVHQLKLILELNPQYQPAWDGLGSAYRGAGQTDAALKAHLEAVRLSNNAPAYLASLGDLYATIGRRDEALEILHRLELRWESEQFSPWSLVQVNRGLGDLDQAYRWMEVALQQRDPSLTILVADPANDILRSDPRFPRFVRELKL